jgi:hypothetical protein
MAMVPTCRIAMMPATSVTQVREETAQSAEAAETAVPSQTGRDVPLGEEEKLMTSGMSAGAVAAPTDEERRAAWKANHQARLAGKRAIHEAQLDAMKQRLTSLEARLQELWQDLGGARRPAPTKVHLRATPAVEKQLEKAEMLLLFTERHLEPTEWSLTEAEGYLRSAKEHLEAAEAQLAPAGAPPMSIDNAVVGALHAGERAEGHWRKGGRRGVQAALLLTGKAAPRKSYGRRATTRFRWEGPQRTRSGAFRSGPGAYRGRREASEDATDIHRSEVQAVQWRRMPTQ